MRRALPELGVTELYWPLISPTSANIYNARPTLSPFNPRAGLHVFACGSCWSAHRSSRTTFVGLLGEN
jgi:hypothetical protein